MEAAQARKMAFCSCVHICRFSDHLKSDTGAESTTDEIKKQVQMLGTDHYEDCRYQISLFLQKVKRGVYAPSQMERYLNALLEQVQASYAAIFKAPREVNVQEERLPEQDPQEQSVPATLADLKKRLADIYSYRSLDEYAEALSQWLETVHEKTDNRSDEFRNRQKLEEAIRYIHDNYSKDLNMAVVSNHVSMNYSLFSQEFKQYTGENFVSYLRNIRMEEAKRLLAQTQLRVVEISQRVGYENEKHFMKTFKSVYGVSPSEFRKNMEYTVGA